MGKAVIYLFFILILISSVLAINFQWLYNPYTAKLDRSISLNQTGDNFTADYFFGSGQFLTGVTSWGLIPTWLFNNSDSIEFNETRLNSTINEKLSDYYNYSDVYNKSEPRDNLTVLNDVELNLNWTKLQNYPVACPAYSYLTQLEDSVTCSAITKIDNDLEVNGNLNITGNITNYNQSFGMFMNETCIIFGDLNLIDELC